MSRPLAAALAVALSLAACDGEDRSPEGAVRKLVKCVEDGNASEAYRLLAPESQRELVERARVANAQVGGGQRFKPEDMLALGHVPARHELALVKRVSEQGERAVVQLQSKRGAREDLVLRKVEGHWRVILPGEKEDPPAAEKPPAADQKG